MPTKGNPIIKGRVPPELLDLLDQLIQESHTTRRLGPWDASAFIRDAVREKIAKRERGRKRYGRKQPRSSEDLGDSSAIADESAEVAGRVPHPLDRIPPKG